VGSPAESGSRPISWTCRSSARYTFGKVVRGYLFAGPSFDFKVSAKVEMQALVSPRRRRSATTWSRSSSRWCSEGAWSWGPCWWKAVERRLTDLAKESDGEGRPTSDADDPLPRGFPLLRVTGGRPPESLWRSRRRWVGPYDAPGQRPAQNSNRTPIRVWSGAASSACWP